MANEMVNPAADRDSLFNSPSQANSTSQPSTAELIEQLRTDRLWLLRQIDAGRWPQWRLDLAALERELGQLLDQAAD